VTIIATIERLDNDLVAIAQCLVLDAEAFPHPSVWFGSRSPFEQVWVARDVAQPRVVGFLASGVECDALHVQGIAVERAFRRNGLGRALLRAATNDAVERALATVMLCVSVTNRSAISLYESEGFSVTRRRRNFYSSRAFGGERDALEMHRTSGS